MAATQRWQIIDIFEAARSGDAGTIIKLISEGADVNALSRGGAPAIYYAAWHGKLDALQVLLENGADVNKAIDPNYGGDAGMWGSGWTALHAASEQDDVEVAKLLLDRGANINAVDHAGWTPLFLAMDEALETEVAGLLIRRGADVNLVPPNEQTLLYMARQYRRPDLEKLLREAGAKDD